VYTWQKDVDDQIDVILKIKLGHSSPFDNDNSVNGRIPAYPIFSSIEDPLVHALTAMFVGCDACPNGRVEGTGPKVAKDSLDKHYNLSGVELHDVLAEAIRMMKGPIVKDKDAIL
jgi:hypothetical protein